MNGIVPWVDIRVLVANWLIALDKYPGVGRIGIGKTLQHVLGKAVHFATRVDVELSCGADQLCGSVRSGIEGAVHAMTSLFSRHAVFSGWGVLLVNASNAFNSLNRTVDCTCFVTLLLLVCFQHLSGLDNFSVERF